MEEKAVIFQLIPWEKRKSFFGNIDFKDGKEYDFLYIGIPQKVSFWRRFLGMYKRQYIINPNSSFIPFHKQLAIWVRRPHNFKLGDEVEVNVNITKTNIASEKVK